MDLKLEGTVAIVTGASRGLGAAAAEALVAEGAHVVAAARSQDALDELAGRSGGRIHAVRCDMHDREEVAGLADVAVDRFGRLDCVVNNAGIAPAGTFLDQDPAVLADVVAVNVLAPAVLAQAAGRHFVAEGVAGSIINIGSTSSLKGKPLLAAYSASKGALARFTEALAAEWARYGIRVNMIAPVRLRHRGAGAGPGRREDAGRAPAEDTDAPHGRPRRVGTPGLLPGVATVGVRHRLLFRHRRRRGGQALSRRTRWGVRGGRSVRTASRSSEEVP